MFANFDPVHKTMTTDQPTFWFRYFDRYVGPITKSQHPAMRPKEKVLQQLWNKPDGTQQWRDVPTVMEADNFPAPD